MEIKTRILELLNEMHDDSKTKSYKAERELCEILTKFINKQNAFEKALDAYIHDYPKRIYTVESEYKYKKLPEEIYCNDDDFTFKTEWLDIDWEGDEEIFVREEDSSKPFNTPTILGCENN